MKKWWIIWMFGILLLAACGSTEMNESSGEGGEEMTNELTQQIKEENGDYFLVITNGTEEDVTLTFTSGQQFEYQLFDDAGETVYTYSMNKMFTQALSEQVVAAGESWEQPLDLKNELTSMSVPEGTYRLEVWSLAEQFDGEKVSIDDFEWSGQ